MSQVVFVTGNACSAAMGDQHLVVDKLASSIHEVRGGEREAELRRLAKYIYSTEQIALNILSSNRRNLG